MRDALRHRREVERIRKQNEKEASGKDRRQTEAPSACHIVSRPLTLNCDRHRTAKFAKFNRLPSGHGARRRTRRSLARR
jgi:hypothetical protein